MAVLAAPTTATGAVPPLALDGPTLRTFLANPVCWFTYCKVAIYTLYETPDGMVNE